MEMDISVISSEINKINVTDNNDTYPKYINESVSVTFMLDGKFECSCKIFFNGRESFDLLEDIKSNLKKSIMNE